MSKTGKSRAFLSKSTFIRGWQCEKSYYLHKKRPFLRDRLPPEQLAKFIRGTNVGVYARELFAGGVNAAPGSHLQIAASVKRTASLLGEGCPVIYEAAFEHEGVRIALDILVADGEAWRAIEVKSSRAISETYLWDAALQYHVLSGSGLKISRFDLVHMNADYEKQGTIDLHKLFSFCDVTETVVSRQPDVASLIEKLRGVESYGSSPDIPIGLYCNNPYPCDFRGHCWKKIPAGSVFQLIELSSEEQFELYNQGIVLARDIPAGFPAREKAKSQIESILAGRPLVDAARLHQIISGVKDPVILFVPLEFSPAIPMLDGTKPHESMFYLAASSVGQADEKQNLFHWPLQWPEVEQGSTEQLFVSIGGQAHVLGFGPPPEQLILNSGEVSPLQITYTDLSAIFKNGTVVTPAGFSSKSVEDALQQLGGAVSKSPGRIQSDPEAASLFEKNFRHPNDHDLDGMVAELKTYLEHRLKNLGQLWEILQDKVL